MLHARSEKPHELVHAEFLSQIDRLIESPLLQGSEALCRLVRYLAEHTLNYPGEHLKEYQIATEVLGRPPDFDPHADSSVRVQVGRLRTKLAEYYSSIGTHDPILVEIPKGKYTLSFQNRTVDQESGFSIQILPMPTPLAPVGRRGFGKVVLVSSVLACVLVGTGALIVISRQTKAANSVHSGSVVHQQQSALERLWTPFLHGEEEPFVVFKNATFTGNSETGLRRFDPSRDNPDQQIQRYTGIGEVMGVLELDQLFDKFGSHFRVKRDGLFTVDDARHNNLIFVGSPGKNQNLNEIPGTREFTFRRLADRPHQFKRAVVDSHPRSGTTGVYAARSGTKPEQVDYAIVALVRGLDPSRWTLFLEGTSTVATQAAVDFVCNEGSISELIRRLRLTNSTDLKPFEVLLRVKTANDVPLETQLVDQRTTEH
jgi:hypothetical protein